MRISTHYSFATIYALLIINSYVRGEGPIPPPRKDCIPGYTPCNLDYRDLQVGKVGALTFGLLTTVYAVEDVQKQALGQGPAGVTGTDNAENFYLPDPEVAGPRVGRKLRGMRKPQNSLLVGWLES